jgi:hypothetical protein
MSRRSWNKRVKENAVGASELALQLAQDKKSRERLLSAVEHLTEARRRVRRGRGPAGAARGLAADQALQAELRNARRDLQQAYARLNAKRRGHRLRRITSLAALASLAAVPQVRERVSYLIATAARNRQHLQGSATGNEPRKDQARPNTLEDLTKEELYARAQETDIPGRSEMSKEELIAALRAKG